METNFFSIRGYHYGLIHTRLEMYRCTFSNGAAGALVLKQQDTSSHIADSIFILLDQFHLRYYFYCERY